MELDLSIMIQWGKHQKENDVRMCRCVLKEYYGDCPAKTPEACICKNYPAHSYLRLMEQKYGKDDPE